MTQELRMRNVRTIAELQSLMQEAQTRRQTILLDFTASWCGPCKAMAPTVHDIARAYSHQFVVATVDVDAAERPLVDHFQVSSVPMFVFLRDGKIVHLVKGKKQEEVQLVSTVIARTSHPELLQ